MCSHLILLHYPPIYKPKEQPPYFQVATATPNQKTILILFKPYTFDPTQSSKKKKPRLPCKSVNHSKQRMESMSKIVNRMLDITKNMSKSIAMMQDSWDQMIEVLDKQSNVILEINEQSMVQGSHEISDNQSDHSKHHQ